MKRILFVLLCAVLCGCNTITFTETKPDGTKVEIRCLRALWSSESYEAVLEGRAKLSASKSKSDADALGAVAEGAARGASK